MAWNNVTQVTQQNSGQPPYWIFEKIQYFENMRLGVLESSYQRENEILAISFQKENYRI